jgi:hypothetical protein
MVTFHIDVWEIKRNIKFFPDLFLHPVLEACVSLGASFGLFTLDRFKRRGTEEALKKAEIDFIVLRRSLLLLS